MNQVWCIWYDNKSDNFDEFENQTVEIPELRSDNDRFIHERQPIMAHFERPEIRSQYFEIDVVPERASKDEKDGYKSLHMNEFEELLVNSNSSLEVKPSHMKVLECDLKYAENASPNGQRNVIFCHQDGINTEKDELKWNTKHAESGKSLAKNKFDSDIRLGEQFEKIMERIECLRVDDDIKSTKSQSIMSWTEDYGMKMRKETNYGRLIGHNYYIKREWYRNLRSNAHNTSGDKNSVLGLKVLDHVKKIGFYRRLYLDYEIGCDGLEHVLFGNRLEMLSSQQSKKILPLPATSNVSVPTTSSMRVTSSIIPNVSIIPSVTHNTSTNNESEESSIIDNSQPSITNQENLQSIDDLFNINTTSGNK
ncbi:6417_t:CDS:2 [Cetraspora pellucida]|uniref:6417_t:CDS:1 n=1 Tax=Cetraspora pellucida TaxID=1433469 RepID=A0A9N8ZAG1_9GLOM|nr:6417_t:CDS:2 [Cetraspora pellucida]